MTTGTHVTNLVQKQRSSVGQLELALTCLMGVGKRALFVTKQFTFQQRFADRRAIDGNQHFITTIAQIVDHLSDHFLAGSIFARDQNRQISPRDFGDGLFQVLNFETVANQVNFFGRDFGHVPFRCNQLFDMPSLINCDHGMGCQLSQRGFIAAGKVPFQTVDQFESSDGFARLVNQRNAQQVSCFKAQLRIDFPMDHLLLIRHVIIDSLSRARFDNLPHQSSRCRNPQLTRFNTKRRFSNQSLLR